MRFKLEGLEVFFPYDYVYPEQFSYMTELKHALDAKGDGILEMPTGTGKTVSLLALITSYQLAHPECGKLVYCTRTVQEMKKTMEEVKRVISYRERVLAESAGRDGEEAAKRAIGAEGDLLAVCLSTRRNLCIHPRISDTNEREVVDAACRSLTASWVRSKSSGGSGAALCDFFEGFSKDTADGLELRGIYDLDDLKALGTKKTWCPYFLARMAIASANIVVYNYQYMLDPKISALVSKSLDEKSIVVFDEAHNIDNVCLESLSVSLDRRDLDGAVRNLNTLATEVKRVKRADAGRLQEEYARLVRGLGEGVSANAGGRAGPGGGAVVLADELPAPAALPPEVLAEAMPGNIRNAELFVRYMQLVVRYLREKIKVRELETIVPKRFLEVMARSLSIDVSPLKFSFSRLQSLLRTLEVTGMEEFHSLSLVADFCSIITSYETGFLVVLESHRPKAPHIPDPLMQLVCLDAGLAIRPVFKKYASVILTSGTLSPLDMYPKILDFRPSVRMSLEMSVDRQCILPMVISRGSNQVPLNTKYERRNDPGVIDSYGDLLVSMCNTVPDGVIAFFPSYSYMENAVSHWHSTGKLRALEANKLVFMETKDVLETTLALTAYKRACDSGRGALLFSIARGKVAEGIDFDRHYGRAVLLFGIPYQFVLSVVLRARMAYARDVHHITEKDYLNFDALKQSSQCVGRIIRSKRDYGIIVFADSRYGDADKLEKLPKWVRKFLYSSQCNLSAEAGISLAKRFLKKMAQPPPSPAPGEKSLTVLTLQDIQEHNEMLLRQDGGIPVALGGAPPQRTIDVLSSLGPGATLALDGSIKLGPTGDMEILGGEEKEVGGTKRPRTTQ